MERNTRLEQVGDGWVRWPQQKSESEICEEAWNAYLAKRIPLYGMDFASFKAGFNAGFTSKKT